MKLEKILSYIVGIEEWGKMKYPIEGWWGRSDDRLETERQEILERDAQSVQVFVDLYIYGNGNKEEICRCSGTQNLYCKSGQIFNLFVLFTLSTIYT